LPARASGQFEFLFLLFFFLFFFIFVFFSLFFHFLFSFSRLPPPHLLARLGANLGVIPEKPFISGPRITFKANQARGWNENGALRNNEVLEMADYAIVRLEADEIAVKEDIVRQFNSYLQQTTREMSFVHEKEGYFRLSCGSAANGAQSGVAEFGSFLQSTGYSLTGIRSMAAPGENSTEISFSKEGHEAHVTLSTLGVH